MYLQQLYKQYAICTLKSNRNLLTRSLLKFISHEIQGSGQTAYIQK